MSQAKKIDFKPKAIKNGDQAWYVNGCFGNNEGKIKPTIRPQPTVLVQSAM
jgi:hypothetical protein